MLRYAFSSFDFAGLAAFVVSSSFPVYGGALPVQPPRDLKVALFPYLPDAAAAAERLPVAGLWP